MIISTVWCCPFTVLCYNVTHLDVRAAVRHGESPSLYHFYKQFLPVKFQILYNYRIACILPCHILSILLSCSTSEKCAPAFTDILVRKQCKLIHYTLYLYRQACSCSKSAPYVTVKQQCLEFLLRFTCVLFYLLFLQKIKYFSFSFLLYVLFSFLFFRQVVQSAWWSRAYIAIVKQLCVV